MAEPKKKKKAAPKAAKTKVQTEVERMLEKIETSSDLKTHRHHIMERAQFFLNQITNLYTVANHLFGRDGCTLRGRILAIRVLAMMEEKRMKENMEPEMLEEMEVLIEKAFMDFNIALEEGLAKEKRRKERAAKARKAKKEKQDKEKESE